MCSKHTDNDDKDIPMHLLILRVFPKSQAVKDPVCCNYCKLDNFLIYHLLLQVPLPLCLPRNPGVEASSPAFSAACAGTSLSRHQSTTTPLSWQKRMEQCPRCVFSVALAQFLFVYFCSQLIILWFLFLKIQAKPLLPLVKSKDSGKICVVIDLDETLVHSSFKVRRGNDNTLQTELYKQLCSTSTFASVFFNFLLQELKDVCVQRGFTALSCPLRSHYIIIQLRLEHNSPRSALFPPSGCCWLWQ